MAESDKPAELPAECWETIMNSLDQSRSFESLSLVSTQFLSTTNHLRRSLTITPRTAPSLPRLLRRFPNLAEIKLREFRGEIDSLLFQIAESPLDLVSLDISEQFHFPSAGLAALGSKMRNLKRLSCSRFAEFNNCDLVTIGDSFPFLQDLDISFPEYYGSRDQQPFVTDEGIADLSAKLADLRRIDVSGNQFITDKSVSYLSLNCALLSDIVLLRCDFVTQNGIAMILRGMASLKSVALDGIGIPTSPLDSFVKESFAVAAKSLVELHLSSSFISDELLSTVAGADLPLEKLSISHCYNYTSVGVHCLLQRCRLLSYLDLEGANFLTDEDVIGFSICLPNITFINLGLCCKLTGLTFFALMKACPLLEDVKMERTNLGVEEFDGLPTKRSRIRNLDLTGNNSLNDECLKRVAACCPDLEMLNISDCPSITEDGVTCVLRNCIRLRHLEISRCLGIKCLSIDFELPRMEVLKAQGSVLDNEALAAIAWCCRGLLHLDLESCLSVTKQGIGRVVERCERLREVNLLWCENLEADVVASMVFRRPSLRKVVPPRENMFTDQQRSLFLRHGCFVSEAVCF